MALVLMALMIMTLVLMPSASADGANGIPPAWRPSLLWRWQQQLFVIASGLGVARGGYFLF